MKLKTAVVFVFTLAYCHVFSQYQLSGKIYDSSDHMPLKGCTIIAGESDMGTVTDTNGSHTIKLSPGQYTLKICHGYKR
jgi:hypothetical protein